MTYLEMLENELARLQPDWICDFVSEKDHEWCERNCSDNPWGRACFQKAFVEGYTKEFE